MERTTAGYGRPTTAVVKNDYSVSPDLAERGNLTTNLSLLEGQLEKAVERVSQLDSRICPAPADAGFAEKHDPSTAVLPTVDRCIGLMNRLHLALNSLETNIG